MFISESRNFIYIHNHKTAGWSIREDLSAQAPDMRSLGAPHGSARDAIALIGRERWDSAFSFAFVRNPWDRLVSWWSMIDAHRPRLPLYRIFRNAEPRIELWRYALRNARTFEQFIVRCSAPVVHDPERGDKSFVRPQTEYLVDDNGEICVDFVARYESLQDDYATIRARIGLEQTPLGRIRHKSSHAHYSSYYNDRTRQIVAERFAADIERFGYRFEVAEAIVVEPKPAAAAKSR